MYILRKPQFHIPVGTLCTLVQEKYAIRCRLLQRLCVQVIPLCPFRRVLVVGLPNPFGWGRVLALGHLEDGE
jgi:hypothetical protein